MILRAHLPRVLSRLSLRSGFMLTCGGLGLLAVLAATALLVIAPILHGNALDMTAATVREQIARDVELDLLLHSHLSNLAVAGRRVATDLEATQETGIREHLADAHQLAGTALERETLSELEANVVQYFALRKQLESQPVPLAEVIARSGDALELALRKAGELRAIARTSVAQAHADIQRIDGWVNVVALGLGAVVLTSVVGLSIAAGAILVRPVRALADAIGRFGSGDMSTRADEGGPRELREIAHTFNQMASTIVRQRENELTSLAGVAHDLNNPIAALQMLTEPRRLERALASEEYMRRTLAMVHRQAQRIHRMVSDLSDAAGVEAGALQLELGEHDLRELAAVAVELYQDVSELHEVRLSVPDTPVLARCDAGRIEQALQNIIANAIKYSPRGGLVSVSASIDEESATLSVSDEGIGLTDDQRARIFDAFQRFGPPGISGAGLGLCLVKRIVQAHGGRVEVDSALGTGSIFRIRVPRARRAAPPLAKEPGALREGERSR